MDNDNVSQFQPAPSEPVTPSGNGGGIESRLASLEFRMTGLETHMQYVATKEDIQKLATLIAERESFIKVDIEKLATTTKVDIEKLATTTKEDIQKLATTTKEDIQKLATLIAETETSMLKWFIGTMLAALSIFFMAGVAVIRLFS